MPDPLPDFSTASGLPREAYALLAQANLLRMRGCWAEAIEKCMAALRLSPENASAQSLLGDIYENQGLLDDAIQWYRMALDVQPDSPADTLKLARLIDAKSRLLPSPPPPAPPVPDSLPAPAAFDPLPAPLQWLRRTLARDPERALRRAAYAAGLLVVAVIAAALLLSRPNARPVRQVNAPPLVLSTPVTPSNLSDAPPAVPAPSSAPAAPRDPAEQSLLDTLRAVPQLAGTGVTVADVEDDPRTGHLTLTLFCAPPSAAPLSRAFILDCALRGMQSAAALSDTASVSLLTVRCLLATPGGSSTPLLFTADSARAALSALGQSPTPAQLQTAFTNPWWSPSAPAS